jgi:hypothetical protein
MGKTVVLCMYQASLLGHGLYGLQKAHPSKNRSSIGIVKRRGMKPTKNGNISHALVVWVILILTEFGYLERMCGVASHQTRFGKRMGVRRPLENLSIRNFGGS